MRISSAIRNGNKFHLKSKHYFLGNHVEKLVTQRLKSNFFQGWVQRYSLVIKLLCFGFWMSKYVLSALVYLGVMLFPYQK